MHKANFFPKLAAINLRKNGQFYLPYLLTIVGTAAAYYIAVALAHATDLPVMTRYAYLIAFMQIGTVVIALFAIIFLTYTNSFLMKRRKRELGLYNILGLDKRHIAVVLGFETLYTAIVGIGGGLAAGMLLQKLVTLLLYKVVHMEAYFGFYLSLKGILSTVVLFSLILFGNLLVNLGRIRVQKPIELLREGNAGEREPKTKWVLAVLGLLSLGGGYWIAVTTDSAVKALGLYFVAVFLVIIGTYCLFSAVSIVLLKALRANKKFYYQINHFIGISGMLYRMKRNAVGLANICILSTMVLVMVSGTLSLYLGTERAIADQFPGNVAVDCRYDPLDQTAPFDSDLLSARLEGQMEQAGLPTTAVYNYHWLDLITLPTGENTYEIQKEYSSDSCRVCLISATEYRKISSTTTGSATELTFTVPGSGTLTVSGTQLSENAPSIGSAFVSTLEPLWVVLPDDQAVAQVYELQASAVGGPMDWYAFWNVDATPEQQKALISQLETSTDFTGTGNWEYFQADSAASFGEEYYSMNGGFFFLGMFLGILFVMATVLIIYYKQIAEGYEDRERYQIMQKVGMEQQTVRHSIRSQILVVFFAPLGVAAVHILFNYGLMVRLLTLFSLYQSTTTLWCTLGTFTLFAAVYGLVYWGTAKAYYRIVRNERIPL